MTESPPVGGTEHIAQAIEKVSFERSGLFIDTYQIYTHQSQYMDEKDLQHLRSDPVECSSFWNSIHEDKKGIEVAKWKLERLYHTETEDLPLMIKEFVNHTLDSREDFEEYRKRSQTMLAQYDNACTYLQSLGVPSLFQRYITEVNLHKAHAKEQIERSVYEHAEQKIGQSHEDFQWLRDLKKELDEKSKGVPVLAQRALFAVFKNKFRQEAIYQINNFIEVQSIRIQDLNLLEQVFENEMSDRVRFSAYMEKSKVLLSKVIMDNLQSLPQELQKIENQYPFAKNSLQEALMVAQKSVMKYPALQQFAPDLDRAKI